MVMNYELIDDVNEIVKELDELYQVQKVCYVENDPDIILHVNLYSNEINVGKIVKILRKYDIPDDYCSFRYTGKELLLRIYVPAA